MISVTIWNTDVDRAKKVAETACTAIAEPMDTMWLAARYRLARSRISGPNIWVVVAMPEIQPCWSRILALMASSDER